MRVLAIDPGPNMGYALADFDSEDKSLRLLDSAILRLKGKQYRWLCDQFELGLSVCVVENYIISPKVYGHSHEGDQGLTLRMIGAIEMLCFQYPTELVLQLPATKPVGYGFLGKKYVRGKREMHAFDAMAHLVYYLVTVEKMPPLS